MSDSSPVSDPFAFQQGGGQQDTGALGVPMSAWQHLAMFGGNLAAAANARTPSGHLAYGSGFGGPFGAAIGQTMQESMGQARAGASIQEQRAQARKTGAEATMSEMSIPYMQQLQQLKIQMMNNPAFRQQLMGQLGTGQDQGFSTPQFNPASASGQQPQGGGDGYGGQPTPVQAAMHQNESGGRVNTPGIVGDGGAAAGPAQIHQAALQDVNQHWGTNYTLKQLTDDPQLGTHVGDVYLSMQQKRFAGDPIKALAAYNAGPGTAEKAFGPGGAGVMGLPKGTQTYLSQAVAGGMPASPGADPDLYASAQADFRRANQVTAQKSMGMPVFADENVLRASGLRKLDASMKGTESFQSTTGKNLADMSTGAAAAGAMERAKMQAQMEFAGPIAGQKALFAPPELRSDSMLPRWTGSYNQDGTPQMTFWKNPKYEQFFNDAGQGIPGHINPASPDSPPGTPGTFAPIQGPGGQPLVSKLGPGQEAQLKFPVQAQEDAFKHDTSLVNEDLAHTIENVAPAKQQLFQLRSLLDNPQTATGAAGEFRANFRNWVQTFAPDFVSQVTGDASPLQEFKKISLMGAGRQERGDLGSRGGFRAIELYLKANPQIENQPVANRDMVNALLVSHQYHEDYATGAAGHYNSQYAGLQKATGPTKYNPITNYDTVFNGQMRPELYASAISAMNGASSDEWAKGLNAKQQQIVGGILQRADPSAMIDVHGQKVRASAFSKTTKPTDLVAPNG